MAHCVAIVGGGFGGLQAAKALARAGADVTLVDRRNFHLFQPLLYQVATGGLSPGEIASPLRAVLSRWRNARTLLGEVVDLDPARRALLLADGGELRYDSVIFATGARHHYFGNDQWEPLAPGLKTIEDATEIRRRILLAFEMAERETDPAARAALLTFVIVGAGPTGLELAGALGEIANDTLKHDFRAVDPSEARIILLEGVDRVLPTFPPDLSAAAERALIRLNVRPMTGAMVTAIDKEGVTFRLGNRVDRIPARTVLWAAGVQASRLGKVLHDRIGAPLDRAGRVIVNPDLTVLDHPEIYVIGDLANFSHQTGKPLPGVAPVAMAQGRYAAKSITARAAGGKIAPFHYMEKGNLATIGRSEAVADFGRIKFDGFVAWLLWLFIHLMYLVGFANRLIVLIEWAYNYLTRNRGARLITGDR